MIYQDINFKIRLSLFGWKENILPKMHIVQWITASPTLASELFGADWEPCQWPAVAARDLVLKRTRAAWHNWHKWHMSDIYRKLCQIVDV